MKSKSKFKTLFCFLLAGLIQSCGTSSKLGSSTPSSHQNRLVKTARQFIGSNYQYGGNGPRAFDCSGLVSYVFGKHGIELPRQSQEQAKVGQKVAVAKVRPGDLLFFTKVKSGGKINHVAIVTENVSGRLKAIHSSTSKGVIEEFMLESSYWAPRFHFAKRVD